MIILICILIICITILIIVYIHNTYRCKHYYKHIRTINVYSNCSAMKYPIYSYDVCRCRKCGKVKKFKI